MKISAAIAVLILAATMFIGIHRHRELTTLRIEHETLAANAAALEIEIDEASPTSAEARRSARARADKNAEAMRAAHRMIDIATRIETNNSTGASTDLSLQDEILLALQSLQTFDTAQLQTLLQEFHKSPALTDGMRNLLLQVTVGALAERNPQVALAMLTDGERLQFPGHTHGITTAISTWASTDPDAALAWIRAHPLESIDSKQLHSALIEGTARTDLRVAAGLIQELGATEHRDLTWEIARKLTDASQCSEWLDILRKSPEHFDPDTLTRTLSAMGAPLAREGFENGTRWISNHLHAPEEIGAALAAVTAQPDNPDVGRWIEWSATQLPESTRDTQIETIISNWTTRDHRAAGEWLATLPDGPAKTAAVTGFAKTVARYEPATAMQWALTLPPGAARDTTLREIQNCIPKTQP